MAERTSSTAGTGSITKMDPWQGPPVTPLLATPPRETPRDRLILTASWGSQTLNRKIVDGIARSNWIPLVVDRARACVLIAGRELRLEGCDTLLDLLSALIKAQGPLSIQDLYERVWGHRPIHRSQLKRVHYHVCRFRRMIEEMSAGFEVLSTCPTGYRLQPGMHYVLVELPAAPIGRMNSTDVHRVLAERGFVDNRTYRQLRKISRSLAARELRRLVENGVLVKDGQGRAARYRASAQLAA